MAKWKATLPRDKAPAGKSDVVFAYRSVNGARHEFTGAVDDELAVKILSLLWNHKPAKARS